MVEPNVKVPFKNDMNALDSFRGNLAGYYPLLPSFS